MKFSISIALGTLGLAALVAASSAQARPDDLLSTAQNEWRHGASLLATPDSAYVTTLATCRRWKGGSIDRRALTPADDPYISRCLQRQGWKAGGIPAFARGPLR
jgi:hypothetical protein